MSNACSNCEYSKECSESVESDGYEVCQIKVIVGKMLKKIKNNKKKLTERDLVIKSGRY